MKYQDLILYLVHLHLRYLRYFQEKNYHQLQLLHHRHHQLYIDLYNLYHHDFLEVDLQEVYYLNLHYKHLEKVFHLQNLHLVHDRHLPLLLHHHQQMLVLKKMLWMKLFHHLLDYLLG
tara:strand:- start:1128 stop:1481 length:354 start_codon:yes stop_codon:yes gene_type:complete